jgi:multidrug efflux system membrane fusion protein
MDTHLSDPQAGEVIRRPAPSRRKVLWRLGLVSLALALVGGGLYGFDQFRKTMIAKFFAGNVPPPASVAAEVATVGALPRFLEGIGTLAAVHQVTVAPEVAGRITAILFEPGAMVSAGQPLLQLNDAPDRADLANFHAQEHYAQLTLERARTLAGKNYATQASVDQAQSQMDTARAGGARIEAAIAQKLVRAPFAGQLGVRQVDLGQILAAGTAIVTLTNLDRLYVNFTLPEQARSALQLGQTVALRVSAFPGTSFTGTIATIEPQIDAGTRAIKVQATLDNREHRLLPGMFAAVSVVLPPEPGVVTVPETAIDYSAYGESVYLVRDDGRDAKGEPRLKAVQTFVKVGSHHDGRVAILDGVAAGDRVVSAGQIKLHNGAPVSVSTDSALVQPAQPPVN